MGYTARETRSAAAGELHEELVAVERVRRRPGTPRRRSRHRLVAAELRLEHALAAREARQLVLQVADTGDRQDGVDHRQPARRELATDAPTEPPEHRQDARSGPDGSSSARLARGSQTQVPARSRAAISTSLVSRRKSAADVAGDM